MPMRYPASQVAAPAWGRQTQLGRPARRTCAGRLRLSDVQTRRADLPCPQRLIKGAFIHQAAPGGIDQNRPRLHLRQARPVHQVPGLFVERTVERDKIRLPEKRVQIHILPAVGGEEILVGVAS